MLYNELYLNIVRFLLPRDIAQVSLASRNMAAICNDESLWKDLFVRRFGTEQLEAVTTAETPTTFKEQYKEKSPLCITAKMLNIIWMNNHYWTLEDAPELSSGTAATLSSVCWFDVSGLLRAVPRGKYKVSWRLLFSEGAYGLESLEFIATVQTDDPVITGIPVSSTSHSSISAKPRDTWVQTLKGKGWIEYQIPDVLDVDIEHSTLEFLDVSLVIKDHSNSWKSGMKVDGVRLRRV